MSEISAYMVGREIKEKFPRVNCARGKKILEIRNLNAGRLAVSYTHLDVYKRQVLGDVDLIVGIGGIVFKGECLAFIAAVEPDAGLAVEFCPGCSIIGAREGPIHRVTRFRIVC